MRKYYKFLMCVAVCAMCSTAVSSAQTSETDAQSIFRHEVRIGVGDPFGTHIFNGRGHDVARGDISDFKTPSPLVGLDYFYSVNSWLKVGAKVGFVFSEYDWKYKPEGMPQVATTVRPDLLVTDLWVMPSVKFSYFRSQWVRLYSGVSIGVNCRIAENDPGEPVRTATGLGVDVTALGVSVGKGHWFGDFELGGTFGTVSAAIIPTRILSISAGYRF